MKSNDTLWLGRRWTVMKMEPALPEPSCGTTEASVAISGIQHCAGNLSKINWLVLKNWVNEG